MKKGFTLIELLAVIVILALIALITIPAVLRITENAKISSYRRSIDLYGRSINTAVMAYKSDMVEKKQSINVNFDNVIPYVDYEGYDISCEISRIYSDDTVLLTKCTIEKDIVYAEKVKGFGKENYYYYTNSKKRIKALLYVEAVNNAIKGKDVGTICEVTNEGNIRCNNQTIEIMGELGNPKSGTLYIENNQVTSYSNLKFEDEKAQTQQEVAQVVDEQQINTNPNNDNNNNQNNNDNNQNNNENNNNQNNNNNTNNQNHYATLISDVDNDGEISRGDKYSYEVNDTDEFNFYVLSIEGDKVNLIMDRNICNDGSITYTSSNNYCRYQWHTGTNDNNYGPDTAMINLYNGTKGWTNVPDMVMNYTDENNTSSDTLGYTSIITNTSTKVTTITGKQSKTSDNQTFGSTTQPLKARLPKESEVNGAGCIGSTGSCPVWLMEYMTYWYSGSNDKYSMNNNSEAYQGQIYGYWLLSSYPGNSNFARFVFYNGVVNVDSTTNGGYGARPVITVSISDLSN